MAWKRTEANAVTLPEGLSVGDVLTFDIHVHRKLEDGRPVSTRVRSHRVRELVDSEVVVNDKGEQVAEKRSSWTVAEAEYSDGVVTFPAVEGGWPAVGWEEIRVLAVPRTGEPVEVLSEPIE